MSSPPGPASPGTEGAPTPFTDVLKNTSADDPDTEDQADGSTVAGHEKQVANGSQGGTSTVEKGLGDPCIDEEAWKASASNPYNWTTGKKWTQAGIISAYTFVSFVFFPPTSLPPIFPHHPMYPVPSQARC